MLQVATAAIVLSAIGYGSYYVPVKKYEVYDGVMYQWFMCSGILFGSLIVAAMRNAWTTNNPTSDGFYVAPEGLLSGLLWVLSNILATKSVQYFGLGNYYIWHELTNLGGTFVIGVVGPFIGIPATPPSNVYLAALGFVCVFLGMIPVSFMETEKGPVSTEETPGSDDVPVAGASLNMRAESRDSAAHGSNSHTLPGSPASRGRGSPLPELQDIQFSAAHGSNLDTLFEGASLPKEQGALDFARQSSTLSEGHPAAPLSPSHGLRGLQLPSHVPPLLPNSPIRHNSFRASNAHTWDGSLGRPNLERFTDHISSFTVAPHGSFGGISMIAPDTMPEEAPGEQPAVQSSASWCKGWILALITGCILSLMYLPMLPWRQRLAKAGHKVSGVEYVFSTCVGIYFSSTAWLFIAGGFRRMRRLPVRKSVLRPPLMAGVMWVIACVCQLYAAVEMPYAIAYCLVVGGGLAVSLLWGVFRFKEATSSYNRKCVGLAFVNMFIGITLLGLAT